jgi:hypothetical protein
MSFLLWAALALVLYFGSGLAFSFLKKNLKVATWAILILAASLFTFWALV